ncbi:Leucine Rich Repeat [Seminavis robusta]|uniref:Leucine Rich Repeat n=1 Tax=Seminavis robusta TaxID=568900 RepID=A0A9N8E8R1_9STRA|nr:Leucine Rich Repeat [Seminavis robusta]|eukprot:Sro632_g178630.1 Leucine Rich Repeat (837) ;mRNA; r:3695-6359
MKKSSDDLSSEEGNTQSNPEEVTPSDDEEINLLAVVAARIEAHRTEEEMPSFLVNNQRNVATSDLVSEEGDTQSNPKEVTPSDDEEINMLDVVAARIEAHRTEEKISSFLMNNQKTTSITNADDTTNTMIQEGKGQQQKEVHSAQQGSHGTCSGMNEADMLRIDRKLQQGYHGPGHDMNEADMLRFDQKLQQGYHGTDNDMRMLDQKLQQGHLANVNPTSQPSQSEATENPRTPPQPTIEESQDLAEPGAYAFAPIQPDHNDAEIITEETRQDIGPPPQEQDNSGLAVAREVQDDPEDPRSLPQAEEYNENRESQKRTAQTKESNKRIVLFLGYGICLVVLVVLLVVLLGKTDDGNDALPAIEPVEPNKEDAPMDSSMPPSASPIFEQLLSYFPNYTIWALEVPESPQSKALDWLLDDPDLMEYVDLEWRVKQRFALVTLFHSTDGFNWTNSDNWLSYSHHECFWYASGSIPFPLPGSGDNHFRGEYQNPCHLQIIDTSATDTMEAMNLIEDPAEGSYKQLWFHMNSLEGQLPEEIYWLTNLETMSLFANMLDGPISSQIGQLQDLEAAIFSFTDVTGTLPTEIGMLSDTLAFFLSEKTQLTGALPTEIGMLSKVDTLLLEANDFSGTIPIELFQLTNLQMIYLGSSSLTGTLASDIGLLQDLEWAVLWHSLLTGTLPTELGLLNLTSDFYLNTNLFQGPIPSELGMLNSNLQQFRLNDNQLDSSIPTELGLMSSVISVELYNNSLSGLVPSEIAALPHLTHFLVQENRLTGTIPQEFVSFLETNGTSTLKVFNFSKNFREEQDDSCWVNETFQQTPSLCHPFTTFAYYCLCKCRC